MSKINIKNIILLIQIVFIGLNSLLVILVSLLFRVSNIGEIVAITSISTFVTLVFFSTQISRIFKKIFNKTINFE